MRNGAENPAAGPARAEGPAKKRRRWTGAAECKLGLAAGVTGLIFSRLGQLWIGFDVFAQFTLHFALLAAACLIGWMMPRAKLFTALMMCLAGLVAIGLWPHVASRSPQALASAGPDERALTVASFNTMWVNVEAAAVQAEIERLDADVVTLIEVGPAKRGMLTALRARYPHQADCFGIDYCKLAILSKHPIRKVQSRVGWDGPPYIQAQLGPEAGGLTVTGVHLIRFPHSRAQFRQAAAIADLIETIPGPRLVMGDFNATPFSRVTAMVAERGNLRRITTLPTWPATAGLPQLAIDHIFLSPGIRVLERPRIGQAAGSDHYPVTVRIAVPAAR